MIVTFGVKKDIIIWEVNRKALEEHEVVTKFSTKKNKNKICAFSLCSHSSHLDVSTSLHSSSNFKHMMLSHERSLCNAEAENGDSLLDTRLLVSSIGELVQLELCILTDVSVPANTTNNPVGPFFVFSSYLYFILLVPQEKGS